MLYIDESGSKGSGSAFFVMGLVKTRRPGDLARSILAVRDKHRFRPEFKFSNLTRGAEPVYMDLIDVLADSDVHIGAYVFDKGRYDPFPHGPTWRVQATAAYQLVVGNVNRRELVSVLLDGIATPEGTALDEEVRRRVNGRFKHTTVVTAVCLDSRSTDGLQAADLVASAIAFERHMWAGESKRPPGDLATPKARVARYLRRAFDLDSMEDIRTDRVNIYTEPGRSRL
ncbi:DUF3800 domain-containing protein [Georgenia sp. MJ206]|uniref:DUF3800 domain-containing protein n=1 Tax=Georgenia wangjunii TaxID=3117730 RepID=UPI002F2650AA